MQITELTIHPTNEDLVRAYVSIVFDNCFMVSSLPYCLEKGVIDQLPHCVDHSSRNR
jgi:DNA-binding cell septation regulator SpoVG